MKDGTGEKTPLQEADERRAEALRSGDMAGLAAASREVARLLREARERRGKKKGGRR